MLRRATPLLWIAAVAGALWLIAPYGYPNYDTLYALLWGDELAHGIGPDYGTDPPTPHPLADLWGVIVSPLGALGASDATSVIAYLALGAIGYLVYRLGALWFDRPIGVVAALIVLTRAPFLSNGLRAFVDLPYIGLVLAALVIETRRPRAGWPVLALLAVAGLLRPEAWLFSVAYLAYLALERDPERSGLRLRRRVGLGGGELAGLVALAASAPIGWALFDLITAGDPLYSFTATQSRVEDLGRYTGPVDLVIHGPGRLGEVMQWPGAVGAAAGIALTLALMPRRATVAFAAAVLAGVAFAILASSGLAIIARYLLLGSAVLSVFCAATLLGWRLLAPDHPWRLRWQVIAAAVAVMFVVQAPRQYDYLADVVRVLDVQKEIGTDLRRLAESGAFAPGCRPIVVPGVQAVPRLAAWLEVRPSAIVIAAEGHRPRRGYFLHPASGEVAFHYGTAEVPRGFRRVARNDSWLLFEDCS